MTIAAIFILVAGAFFILIASVGLVRMPDIYMRASAVTKAATLGLALMLIAVMFFFNNHVITIKALAIIFFTFLTGPVGAHVIGRAAYFVGDKLWDQTFRDDLKNKYDRETHSLSSEEDNSDKPDS
jgi:multicomponent Na+:H+ antiporter subunit G